jgi:tetratricopeptide (TPR) repeat protein
MTDDPMFNDAMTGTAARPRLNRTLTEYSLRHRLTGAAYEPAEKVVEGAKSTPQALKRGHIFSDLVARLKSRPSYPWRSPSFSFVIVIGTSLLLCLAAPAQTQNQSQAQTRQQLLQELDSGHLRDAVLLGQQAVSRWPRDAQLRHYLGVAYFKTGDFKQAQEQITRARELNPKDSATHFDLALVLLSQVEYAGAAEELEAAIKLSPSKANALAHMLLGRAYLNSNRSLQAIDEFKTALKINPAIKLGHYHLGFAYFSLGRNDEAISEYEEELRRSGESPAVEYELGRSLLESGKYESSLTYLQRATELDAPNPDVWYNLGKAQALAGQAARAESSLRKASELNPKDPSPHYQLARVLEKLGKTEEARSERARFAELKKAQPAAAGMATGRDQ